MKLLLYANSRLLHPTSHDGTCRYLLLSRDIKMFNFDIPFRWALSIELVQILNREGCIEIVCAALLWELPSRSEHPARIVVTEGHGTLLQLFLIHNDVIKACETWKRPDLLPISKSILLGRILLLIHYSYCCRSGTLLRLNLSEGQRLLLLVLSWSSRSSDYSHVLTLKLCCFSDIKLCLDIGRALIG